MFEGLLGMLVFFATILAFGAGIVVIAIALLTRRCRRAGQMSLLLLGWAAVYAGILLEVSFTSQPRYLGLDQERCFDEMCYSVTSVKITPSLTGGFGLKIQAKGNFYVLTVQLRNAGRGAAQKPSYPVLMVVDAQGRQYPHFLSEAQIINWGSPTSLPGVAAPLWGEKIPAGESASETVAFDLPADIRQPGLAVTEGIGPLSAIIIGDEGSLFHAKTEFLLAP
jgi:hypothetical protein